MDTVLIPFQKLRKYTASLWVFYYFHAMSGFLQRVLTAIVFVIVMVGGIYMHPISHVGLFVLITAFCLWEYFDLTLPSKTDQRKWIGIGLGILPILLTATLVSTNDSILTIGNALLVLLPAIAFLFLFW